MAIRVIGLDPGVQTGICYGSWHDNGELLLCPFQANDDVDDMYRRLMKFAPHHIVYETFAFRQGKQHTGINLFPVEIIGVIRLYSLMNFRGQIHPQTPAQGKTYYTDTLLKQLSLYKPGAAYHHGMDALRHVMQWGTYGAGYKYNKSKTSHYAKLVELDYFT